MMLAGFSYTPAPPYYAVILPRRGWTRSAGADPPSFLALRVGSLRQRGELTPEK
jgi:hypothetical protein